ncbi:MAG: hypothetical protein ACK559_12555, partial [bacterium]
GEVVAARGGGDGLAHAVHIAGARGGVAGDGAGGGHRAGAGAALVGDREGLGPADLVHGVPGVRARGGLAAVPAAAVPAAAVGPAAVGAAIGPVRAVGAVGAVGAARVGELL